MNQLAVNRRYISAQYAHRQRRKKKRIFRYFLKLFFVILLAFAVIKAVSIIKLKIIDETYLIAQNQKFSQMQKPQLPNGCEATSLAMALSKVGVDTSKEDANLAIPSMPFTNLGDTQSGADPNLFYAGDATTSQGFYCFAGPVVSGANTILNKNASNKRAQDITGTPISEINRLLNIGQDVIAWVTIDYETPQYCEKFTWLIDGITQYRPFSNLHCVVICGKTQDKYIVNDPLVGVTGVDEELLAASYTSMGNRAVIIK